MHARPPADDHTHAPTSFLTGNEALTVLDGYYILNEARRLQVRALIITLMQEQCGAIVAAPPHHVPPTART